MFKWLKDLFKKEDCPLQIRIKEDLTQLKDFTVKVEGHKVGFNSVITRRVVVFEKRKDQYFVYVGVYGFVVEPEHYKESLFKDKLPLYIIPESKLHEHLQLFRETFYNIVVEEKE